MTAGITGSCVVVISPHELVERAGAPVNPALTIVALREQGEGDLCYYMADGRHGRTDATLAIIEQLHLIAAREGIVSSVRERIVIQAEDMPIDADGISWETQANWRHVRLIPDLYYLQAGGYEDFQPQTIPWNQRDPSIIWRGSTTGRFVQLVDGLDELPRYRLCKSSSRLGGRADFGITDVVQTANDEHTGLIRDRLHREGHLRSFTPFVDMGRHRFIMDIDGNSNSWNFMMKLRLGCCVLRVDSVWRQWFSDRLVPWTHYVPVSSDLSDLEERVDWCFSHPAEAAAIADRGRRFAMDMTFADEMSRAARATFALST